MAELVGTLMPARKIQGSLQLNIVFTFCLVFSTIYSTKQYYSSAVQYSIPHSVFIILCIHSYSLVKPNNEKLDIVKIVVNIGIDLLLQIHFTAANPNTDLVDTLNLNMSSVGDQNVLYSVLMKVCDGINSINKDTKAIRKSVDKLYSKVEDINKRLEVLERNKEIQDKDIDMLKNTQDLFQTEVDTVKSMVESLAEQDKEKKEFDPEVTVIISNVPMSTT